MATAMGGIILVDKIKNNKIISQRYPETRKRIGRQCAKENTQERRPETDDHGINETLTEF